MILIVKFSTLFFFLSKNLIFLHQYLSVVGIIAKQIYTRVQTRWFAVHDLRLYIGDVKSAC